MAQALAGPPPRAGSFIVTIYGDVVEPRGGTLWIGTLIEVSAGHGISEGLVRTAVSRLVASGRLEGERIGRRSYYRLTPGARAEFAAAAKVIFDPPPAAHGWLVRFGEGGVAAELQSAGWANAAAHAVAPDRADIPRPEGLVFSARTVAGGEYLGAWAARHWELAPIAAAYRDFVATFREAAAAIGAEGRRPGDETSLALRLRVLHEYRRVLLADPRLPAAALPPDWPAAEARRLFAMLYIGLAAEADRHVRRTFADAEGPLPQDSPATRARLASLRRELGDLSNRGAPIAGS